MLAAQPTRPSDEEIVQELQKWQRTPYDLERDEKVQQFVKGQLEKYDGPAVSGGFEDASRGFEDASRGLEADA